MNHEAGSLRLWRTGDAARLAWIDRLQGPAFRWTVKEISTLTTTHEIWVCEQSGDLVAWVALQRLPDAWEITALATHPDWTRRGLMRQLLSGVLAVKAQENEIWLEVHEANAPALGLYRSLGFHEVGRRPRYYSDGGAAVLMTRK